MTLLDHTISLGVIGGDAYMLNIVLVGEDIESLNEGWTIVSDNLCQRAVVFLGKDNSELMMVLQTTYLRLHRW